MKINEEDFSHNQLKVINALKNNQSLATSNELLLEAYLLLIKYMTSVLDYEKCFWCDWCPGMDNCNSQYCLHGHECKLSELVYKIEADFKNHD